jgi:hypothetical protein
LPRRKCSRIRTHEFMTAAAQRDQVFRAVRAAAGCPFF